MIYLFKMALRDLGRNRRRSFFSALALGMGLTLLMMIAAVIRGEMLGAMDTGIKLQSGHLQVRAKTYEEDKSSLAWEDLVNDPEGISKQIAALPGVQAATPRLMASGILGSGVESTGVRLLGIDPASVVNDPYRRGILQGAFLEPDDRQGLLIGEPLAKKLGVGVGDGVNLLVTTSNGDVDEQPFTIRGIYTTGTPGFDNATIFLPLAKAQAMTRTEKHASFVFVLLKERDQTGTIASALQTDEYQVLTWEEMNEMLTQFDQYASSMTYFIYLIVLGITATVIVNTLIMAVFERTREIGILSAIGMRSGRIMAMFFAESSLLAVGGIILGLIGGSLVVWYFATYGVYIGDMGVTGMLLGNRIYAAPSLEDAVTLTVITFVITLLAGLYPALLASRMDPVTALHGGK